MRKLLNQIADEALRPDTLPELRDKAKKWRQWATRHPGQETENLALACESELWERTDGKEGQPWNDTR